MDRRERLRLPALRLDYRPAAERKQDFEEACLGFTEESARTEASRCVSCPAPESCFLACPLHNDIPAALWEISQGNFIEAANIFRSTSNWPELCGRLCPDEELCAGSCGIGKLHPFLRVGRLEAFVSDYQRQREGLPLPKPRPDTGRQVAVVGSGPAGLAAAEQLRLRGHQVTVFEMRTQLGGMLATAIPAFRLPQEVVASKVEQLERMGVVFITQARIGRQTNLAALFKRGFDAILLSTGAGFEPLPKVPGERVKGVLRATDFLLKSEEAPQTGFRLGCAEVAVFGAGHAAVDCARAAARLGARHVTCYLPVGEKEAAWRSEDRLAAEEEGVDFVAQTRLVKIFGDDQNNLAGIRCQRLRPEAKDETPEAERRGGTDRFMARADVVILAPERGPDPLAGKAFAPLEINPEGWILCDPESGQTSLEGVFAAGDNTGRRQLASFAIAQARKIAASIHAYLD